jgi:hypothetical protein
MVPNGEDLPYRVSTNGEDSARLPAHGEDLTHLARFFNPYCASPNGEELARSSANGENSPMNGEDLARSSANGEDSPMNGEDLARSSANGEDSSMNSFDAEQAYFGSGDLASAIPLSQTPKPKETLRSYVSRKIMLSVKTIRRILACKETIHKYGVFVPRNDREADSSPEAARWASGRQLEWIRLQEQGTFERNWDWVRLHKAYPTYQKSDVGHVFYVYDHKHSGE